MKEIVLKRRADEQLGSAFRHGALTIDDWEHLSYLLAKGDPLPPEYDEHPLTDNWSGWLECHIHADFLVIYKQRRHEVVIAQVGTHADLFRHRKRKTKATKSKRWPGWKANN